MRTTLRLPRPGTKPPIWITSKACTLILPCLADPDESPVGRNASGRNQRTLKSPNLAGQEKLMRVPHRCPTCATGDFDLLCSVNSVATRYERLKWCIAGRGDCASRNPGPFDVAQGRLHPGLDKFPKSPSTVQSFPLFPSSRRNRSRPRTAVRLRLRAQTVRAFHSGTFQQPTLSSPRSRHHKARSCPHP
jgi:hypothetical protein